MHKPKRWIAVLLALFAQGMGHAYAGTWERALFFIGILTGTTVERSRRSHIPISAIRTPSNAWSRSRAT